MYTLDIILPVVMSVFASPPKIAPNKSKLLSTISNQHTVGVVECISVFKWISLVEGMIQWFTHAFTCVFPELINVV